MCVHHAHASHGEHHSRALSFFHYDVCIIESTSWQMHHVICTILFCTWNISSWHYTGIAIIRFMNVSLSWLSSICTLSWSILSLSLDCIVINKHVFSTSILQLILIVNPEQGCSKNSSLTNPPYYPYVLSMSFVMNLTDNCFPHVLLSAR